MRGRHPGRALGLSLALSASGGAAAESLAPWYCPPPEPEARECLRQLHFGRAAPYMEETVVPMSVRVLLGVMEDPGTHSNYTAQAQVLLTLLESLRLIACVGRYEACYPQAVAKHVYGELCTIAALQQEALAPLMGAEEEPVCEALFGRSEAGSVLLAVAKPLQGLVRAALPEAAPLAIGNLGTRFDYEHFFEARARRYARQTLAGVGARPPVLTYPAVFSPGGLCAAGGREAAPSASPDVDAALGQLADAGVGLSHFVINFGAADGACGAKDDWNADPANCLTAAGAAAVLIEGDRQFHRTLRGLFGRRADVTLITQFVPLENVSALLREQLRSMPAASPSPDLLKVDVDHADCAFMAEALRVVHPKLIHLEYAPQVPPPLDYEQRYQARLLGVGLGERHGGGPGAELAGCSLAAFLRRAPGYALVSAGGEEALLARRDLRRALAAPALGAEEAWRRAALCGPQRSHALGGPAWAFDFRALADASRGAEARLRLLASLLEERGAAAYALRLAPPGAP